MQAFKALVKEVYENGKDVMTVKGSTRRLIGAQARYDASKGIPVLTSKKLNIRWAVAEYAMFLKGITNISFLEKYGAEKLWNTQMLQEDIIQERPRNPNDLIAELAELTGETIEDVHVRFGKALDDYTSQRKTFEEELQKAIGEANDPVKNPELIKEFQKNVKGIEDILVSMFIEKDIKITEKAIVKERGDLGPIYGAKWRAWKAVSPTGKIFMIDQLKNCVDRLKDNPDSRQIILTSWDPASIVPENFTYDQKIANGYMGQPPCHVNYHFLTEQTEAGRVLNVTVWLRSNDLMLGHGFNVFGAGLILHLVAKSVGMIPGEIVMQISDAHIYSNHLDKIPEFLEAEIHPQPEFQLPEHVDVFNFEVEDIVNAFGEYKHSPYIKFDLNTTETVNAGTEA